MLGYLLIGLGCLLWVAAVAAVLRDRRSSPRRRLVTALALAACVPLAVVYWLVTR
ncbi:MAG TPA: hypothetical protein VEK76_12885 [Candidatus Binatia bacterium]|nr:hypothetical protein [Candidatus Binatia bacterium]